MTAADVFNLLFAKFEVHSNCHKVTNICVCAAAFKFRNVSFCYHGTDRESSFLCEGTLSYSWLISENTQMKRCWMKRKVINDWWAPGDSSYATSCVFHITLSFNSCDLPLDVQGVALSACYQEPAEENRKDLWRLESSPPSFRLAALCAEVRNPGGTPGSSPAPLRRLWQGLLRPLKICRCTGMSLYSWKRQ